MVCLEMNRGHSVVFEIASKYCILDSFVNHDGYSISSERFLPAVVDIMVISVKFTHSLFYRCDGTVYGRLRVTRLCSHSERNEGDLER